MNDVVGKLKIKQVIVGMSISMVSDLQMTQQDLLKKIKFLKKEPHIQFDVPWQTTQWALEEWIEAYTQASEQAQWQIQKLGECKDKANKIGVDIHREMNDVKELDLYEATQIIKDTSKTIQKMSKVIDLVITQIKKVKKEQRAIKRDVEKLAKAVKDGAIMAYG